MAAESLLEAAQVSGGCSVLFSAPDPHTNLLWVCDVLGILTCYLFAKVLCLGTWENHQSTGTHSNPIWYLPRVGELERKMDLGVDVGDMDCGASTKAFLVSAVPVLSRRCDL